MKRKLSDRRSILSVSISPVLAIVLSSVWNSAVGAQSGERAGLIYASTCNRVSQGGQDAHPTRNLMLYCGTGILPVYKNGASSELKPMTQSVPPSSRIKQGRQVSLNGRILPLAWTQQPASSTSANIRTWIADVGLMQSAGVELLNTADSTKQPVQ